MTEHRSASRGESSLLRRSRWRSGDAAFQVGVSAVGWLIIAILVGTAVFLIGESWSSLRHFGPLSFLTSTRWAPSEATSTQTDPNPYGIAQFVYGSLLTSMIAMLIAVPVSVMVALYITDMAPMWLRRPLSYLVDLLAAIPSVVYGFWGIFALIPAIRPVGQFLADTLGTAPVIGPLFAGPFFGVSYFTAGVILAIMVLPIITAICREVFAVAPIQEKEAAFALGATRWEMLRMAVLPRSRAGIIGASLLGLGRAIGETIAVTMVIGNNVLAISKSILGQGATMPSVIANEFTEANQPFHLQSLFVVALWLLILALIVNTVGKVVVRRVGKDIA
ncbi:MULTISPECIES: phosphate ABC transporter permease subunit PstC [Micromonospora]|uniref:Phosphate transport system permease protein n=1 Tax=Micromonospora solifontis TaxID=2487138 RepID=A0ABX9WAG3_9ACTN|nr:MULTISPECIES: phosphate ABC transporter permease subunit PstC [Micromonospora]NES17127.1 phosphate ABC transporter permease subunit PstC [Micromonospora sp. PPF5-17B]NES38983.1 phosphate ABC transporter permease subunit PstC [Micromonospora solifontis]NES58896.1 phosphate ABC transporter permease subunit PstC [Micromonospora sp. PPF5-6]RNL91998.1 phosphate ABC transporter permease subunit PstC [Micromonospora solifontis]